MIVIVRHWRPAALEPGRARECAPRQVPRSQARGCARPAFEGIIQ